MGDAADDMFNAAMAEENIREAMADAGCFRCCDPLCGQADIECPTCHDLGWVNEDGEPCEP